MTTPRTFREIAKRITNRIWCNVSDEDGATAAIESALSEAVTDALKAEGKIICVHCGFSAPMYSEDNEDVMCAHYTICPARIKER